MCICINFHLSYSCELHSIESKGKEKMKVEVVVKILVEQSMKMSSEGIKIDLLPSNFSYSYFSKYENSHLTIDL